MIKLSLELPETVAAEFYSAAEELNSRFPGASPKIEARTLMAFALARHDSADTCAQFDLALRLVRGVDAAPFNPALASSFGQDSSPVPNQPAHREEAA